MKQNIIVAQLRELSDKGLANYKAYLKDKYVDVLDYVLDENSKPLDFEQYRIYQLPLLSIGQMIEFLKDLDISLDCINGYWDLLTGIESQGGEIDSYTSQYCGNELCDILWEAVEEILNNS